MSERLLEVDTKVAAIPDHGATTVSVELLDGSVRHHFDTDAMSAQSRFAAGAVSKLFTHALIFRLIDQGKLSYHTPVSSLVAGGSLAGLHVVGGQDFGADLNVGHLIDQTSGLASWEDARDPARRTVLEQIVDWDRVIDVDEQMETSARIGAKFPPGSGQRAHYSDLNAELLAQIAQQVSGQEFSELVKEVFLEPLGMTRSSFAVPGQEEYADIYTSKHPVRLSRYFSSSLGAGGVITTADDLMTFTRAFFGGQLFSPVHIIDPLMRRIQYRPLRYGAGMMSIQHLRTPWSKALTLHGHSGVPGSFAFYCPEKQALIAGTINALLVSPFDLIERYLRAL
ncbi:serine hydrolase domain-containing protein [Corynebacterium alimapuense]|uniref:serine hydrolase domain-containing protein n=1 Tax=Corynebacterium alimapuense TaxID=1576874 RepID=UPI00140311B5|nr:serine hydrolase domain-containing protein [Corynebacterium alimapuense]